MKTSAHLYFYFLKTIAAYATTDERSPVMSPLVVYFKSSPFLAPSSFAHNMVETIGAYPHIDALVLLTISRKLSSSSPRIASIAFRSFNSA